MKSKSIIIIVVLAILGLLVMKGISSYNSMVNLEEGVNEKWSQVENVYQRRADLIPNLVNTVKGYAEHERETFREVIEARAKATSVNVNAENLDEAQIQKFQEAQNQLSSALNKLMVVVERYPDLKANQNFLELQAQLEGTENRIAVERKKFNESVKDYNMSIRSFPTNIFAGIFGFDKKGYFESTPGSDVAPEVKF